MAGTEGLPEPSADLLGAPFDEPLPMGQIPVEDLPDPNTLTADEALLRDLPPSAPAVAENKFERDRKLRVRFQEVKFQALKEPAIREMRQRAERARTDEEKRAALREHYKMLFAKMVAIDPELAERCTIMETAYLRRIGQFRVEPTIPLSPPPTPAPLAN